MRNVLIVSCFAALSLVACAKKTENIAAAPLTPDRATQVAAMGCTELTQAHQYTVMKLNNAATVQDSKASSDKLMVAGGVVFFLPLVFFTDGNSGAAGIAELKGVKEAVEGQLVLKKCKHPGAGLL